MTLKQLREAFDNLVPGHSQTKPWINLQINRAIQVVAHELRLPGLLATADVTLVTTDYKVPLPVDWLKEIVSATPPVGHPPVCVVLSTRAMEEWYGQLWTYSGDVETVCAENGTLYYQHIPRSSMVLKIRYFRKPDPLALDTASPDAYIPDELQEDLLVSFAAANAWSMLEDGIDGDKVNTSYHANKVIAAKLQLSKRHGFVVPAQRWHSPARTRKGHI